MSRLGCDPGQLEGAAAALAAGKGTAEAARTRISQAAGSLFWSGSDSARFLDEMAHDVDTALQDLAAMLQRGCELLGQQASDQRQASGNSQNGASSAGGNSSASGGSGSPPSTQGTRKPPPEADLLRDYQQPADKMVNYSRLFGKIKPERPISESEAKLLDGLNLIELLNLKGTADTAEAKAVALIAEGAEDGHQDALRHALWNALMTQEFGQDWAEDYGNAHERVPGNFLDREAMDLYNNEVGRIVGAENPDASPDELAEIIKSKIDGGELVVIDSSGHLVASNAVEYGNTGAADDLPTEPDPEGGDIGTHSS